MISLHYLNNKFSQSINNTKHSTPSYYRDESTSKAGKVILGGRQRTHVKNGTITKLNILEKHLWRVRVDSIFAEKNKTSFPISDKCDAIFDSSSNKITGPPQTVQKLNYMLNAKFVPGLNLYTV